MLVVVLEVMLLLHIFPRVDLVVAVQQIGILMSQQTESILLVAVVVPEEMDRLEQHQVDMVNLVLVVPES
jgi:tetrahydromethanopterin S-methyltransferase subunit B